MLVIFLDVSNTRALLAAAVPGVIPVSSVGVPEPVILSPFTVKLVHVKFLILLISLLASTIRALLASAVPVVVST